MTYQDPNNYPELLAALDAYGERVDATIAAGNEALRLGALIGEPEGTSDEGDVADGLKLIRNGLDLLAVGKHNANKPRENWQTHVDNAKRLAE